MSITASEVVLFLHVFVTITCGIRVLYHQKNYGVALAWLVVLFVTPLLGLIAYVLIGEPKLGRAREKRKQELMQFYQTFTQKHLEHGLPLAHLSHPWQPIAQVAANTTGFAAVSGNRCVFFDQTDAILTAMVKDIDQAQRSVVLAFYIIEPKGQVERVLEAVLAACQRGVRCEIMADSVGSAGFFKSAWYGRLQEAGVWLHQSLSVGMLKTLLVRGDLRNHRKMLVVDENVAYTGSYNLVDPKVFKQHSGVGQWVDMMVRVEGPAVLHVLAVFYADVAVEREQSLIEVQNWWRERGQFIEAAALLNRPDANSIVQVIPSSPDQVHTVFYDTLIAALYQAQSEIVITTPYLIPDQPLLLALSTAARSGVEVILVVPEKVDSFLVRHASAAYFETLLDSGVRMACFGQGLLHTKSVVIDEQVAFFGTVNMDMRSFYLNLELMLALYSQKDIEALAKQQNAYIENSVFLDATAWKRRPVGRQILENAIRLVSPLL